VARRTGIVPAVATDPSPDLVLTPIGGRPRTISQMLTTFHLAFVAFDPYEAQSSWLLPTAVRILQTFEQADVRVALVVTAPVSDAQLWLGPHAQEFRVFVDPDHTAVRGFGLLRLPAIVHVAMDGTVMGSAEGWHPDEWEKVTRQLAEVTAWTPPVVPLPGDPAPFEGSPA
jgi:hypothetical protein